MRRGPQTWRALRNRAAPRPALGGRGAASEVRRLRDLRARPLAAGAFRRQGLRAAAPGSARRAARHRQHGEGVDRRLSGRRPQPARDRQPRRFSQAHRFLARRGDRLRGRRQDLERDDGRRLRAQRGRRHRLSRARRSRQARARRLRHRRAPVEGLGEARRFGLRRVRAARRAMDGRLRPWSDRGFRRRRGARNRAIAGLRRAARRRRAQAHRAQQRSPGDKGDGRRGPCRFRSWLVARQRRLSAWPSHCDVGRRLRLSQPRSERLRSHRSRRRRPRRAEGTRRVSLYRARRLPLRRNRLRHGALARLRRARRKPACR